MNNKVHFITIFLATVTLGQTTFAMEKDSEFSSFWADADWEPSAVSVRDSFVYTPDEIAFFTGIGTSRTNHDELPCVAPAQDFVLDEAAYSPAGAAAIGFALETLRKQGIDKGFVFSASGYGPEQTHQPVYREIPLLATLYQALASRFNEALRRYELIPNSDEVIVRNMPILYQHWENEDLLAQADALMKVAYAISCLTLEDLASFTGHLKNKRGVERSFEEALTEQDSYLYRAFFYCTNVYHKLRGGVISCKNKQTYPAETDIPLIHSAPYYREGTIQNSWLDLYNDFCDRVRKHIDLDLLEKIDQRFVSWILPDNEEAMFSIFPDTQPT